MARLRETRSWVLGFLLVLFIAIPSHAEDYYVSATTGDDISGDGSMFAPWATISRAMGIGVDWPLYYLYGYSGPERIIHVAEGEYPLYESMKLIEWINMNEFIGLCDCPPNPYTSSMDLLLVNPYTLVGGYDPSDWSKYPLVHPTTLVGNVEMRDSTRLDGFIVKGEVLIEGSNVTVENNVIQESASSGLVIRPSLVGLSWGEDGSSESILVQNNIIGNNTGAGIRLEADAFQVSAEIRNNLVINNNGCGVVALEDRIPDYYITGVFNGIPYDCYSGTIDVLFINNTVANNAECGVMVWNYNSGVGLTLMNDIIWGNGGASIQLSNGTNGPCGGFNEVVALMPPVSYSDVSGGAPGIGNIDADPLFVASVLGNYSLLAGSPAIDAGNTDPTYNDPDGSRNDMGVYGGPGTMSPGTVLVPAGSGISVAPTSDIEITFSEVTDAGVVSVETQNSGPPLDGSFRLGNPPTYYSIITTATYSGPIEVCISYDEADFGGREKNLKLLHFDSTGQVNDVTTSLDTDANLICGEVMGFSTFVLASENPAIVQKERPVIGGCAIKRGNSRASLDPLLLLPFVLGWVLYNRKRTRQKK